MGARLSEFGVPLWPPLLLTCPRCLLAHPCEIIKSLKGTSVTKESYLIAPSDVSSSILRHGHHHPDCQSALTLLTEIPPSNSCLSRFAKIYTSTHPDPCLPSPAAFFLLNRPLAAAAAPDSFSQAKLLTLLHACAALFSVCNKTWLLFTLPTPLSSSALSLPNTTPASSLDESALYALVSPTDLLLIPSLFLIWNYWLGGGGSVLLQNIFFPFFLAP